MSAKIIPIPVARTLIVKHQAIVLDVRTYEEYCQGHLCGAMHIPTPLPPLNKVKLRKLYTDLSKLQLKKFHPIIVYCKKGVRAGISKKMLEDLGYTNVFSLGGVITEPLKSYMKNPKYPEIHICKCA